MLVRGKTKIEREQRSLRGQQGYQLQRGFCVEVAPEFELDAVNDFGPFRKRPVGNRRM